MSVTCLDCKYCMYDYDGERVTCPKISDGIGINTTPCENFIWDVINYGVLE